MKQTVSINMHQSLLKEYTNSTHPFHLWSMFDTGPNVGRAVNRLAVNLAAFVMAFMTASWTSASIHLVWHTVKPGLQIEKMKLAQSTCFPQQWNNFVPSFTQK